MRRKTYGTVFCFCLVIFKLSSTYMQTIYDIIGSSQVSTHSQVTWDVSQLECGIVCSENTCVMAGYNLHTRECFISHDGVSLATSTAENHWIVLVKHAVLSEIPKTGEVLTGHIGAGLHGSVIQYLCHDGYLLTTQDTMSVCVDGKWNPEPPVSCNAMFVDCSVPTSPLYGFGAYIDLNYGSIVTYGCQAGYTIVGNETATCLQGVWNASTPSCAAMCGTAPPPIYGGVYGTSVHHGDVITYDCNQRFVLVGQNTTTCNDGTWTGVLPTCFKDCGRTIDYPNVDVIYEDDTTEGSRAIVSCKSGYQLRNETNVIMVCQKIINDAGMIVDGAWKTTTGTTGEPECWELMFRGTADNGDDAVSVYLGGGLTTTDPACMLVQNNSCTRHYRNPRLDSWETLGVKKVRYEMYNDGEAVMSFVVNATGSSYTDWLYYENDPTSWRGLEWPWEDMSSTSESRWHLNKMAANGYSFKIIRYFSSCPLSHHYTIVLFNPINCFTGDYQTWPKFLYALNNHGANFNTEEYGLASVMAVWVYHD